MLKEINLNLSELLLLFIIIIKFFKILIEKYYSTIIRVIIENNFNIIIILIITLILLPFLGPIILKNVMTLEVINLISNIKLNNNNQLIKIILLISYFLLNLIIEKKAKLIEKQIKIDQLILLDFLVLNSFFLIGSSTLFELLLCIEINNIIFIILTTTKNFQLSSTEAAFKYFFISAITSALFLFGIFIIWTFTGYISFDELNLFFLNNLNFFDNFFIAFGLILLISSFLLKLGFYRFISLLLIFMVIRR